MNSSGKVSRRRLLKGGAAAAVSLPYVIPSGVLASQGRPGANDRVVTAAIGVGGMGLSHVRPDAAALCDVDDQMLAKAKQRVRGEPFLAKDYRRILDRKDIDAVFIGAPDHWHALMTVHACQAGKDVYCEKPACKTVEEGVAMVRAARKYNRVVQIGSQGRSNPNAHRACEFVRNGELGRVTNVDVWHEKNWVDGGWPEEQAPPSHLDWEMWLGPARWRPYHEKYHPFHFRWFMDFGAGFVRDRGAHAFSIAYFLLDMDGYRGPITVEATGTPQSDCIYDVPVGLQARWEFKQPDWTLTWSQPGVPQGGRSWGAVYHGSKESLIVYGGDGGTDPEPKAVNYQVPAGGFKVTQSPAPTADATANHRANFLECVKTRQRPVMDVESGVKAVTLGNIANIAYLLGRKLTFDQGVNRFVDDEDANRMLVEPYRAPWVLPSV